MARFGLVAALAGALLGALVTLQLIATVQNSKLSSSFDSQYKWKSRADELAADDSVFLLGAGKADITG